MGIEIGLDAFDRAATFYGDGLTDITCDADPGNDTCPADLDNDGFIVIGDLLIFFRGLRMHRKLHGRHQRRRQRERARPPRGNPYQLRTPCP